MLKNIYGIGFLIYIVILSAFFIMNIFFRDVDYFRNSMLLNAFFVPFVCVLGAFFSVTAYSRYKKILSFREAYGRAFVPMFVGGIFSILTVFIYINYADSSTKELLNYQYIQSYEKSLEEEYTKAKAIVKPQSAEMEDLEKKYKEGQIRIAEKKLKKEDMFSLQYFSYVLAGYSAFFLLVSLFFGGFFRTKRSE